MDEQRPPDEETPGRPPAPEPQPWPDEGIRPPRRRLRARRLFLLILFAVAAACALGFGYFYATSPGVRAVTRTVLTGRLSPRRAFAGRDQITLLILGRDLDTGPKGKVLPTRGRADLILALRLDFASQRAVLLSIPRDLLVQIPGRSGRHRINVAHALGGPRLTKRTVASALGIRCDHYLVANYEAVAGAIDAIGGVSVHVDQPMDYDDNWGNLHIHLKQGHQRLDGGQAVGFARFRRSNTRPASSDLVRIKRQQALAMALAAEFRRPRTWLRLPHALDVTRRGIATDLSFDQLACLGYTARRLPRGAISLKTLPARPTPRGLVLDPDAPDDFSYLLQP